MRGISRHPGVQKPAQFRTSPRSPRLLGPAASAACCDHDFAALQAIYATANVLSKALVSLKSRVSDPSQPPARTGSVERGSRAARLLDPTVELRCRRPAPAAAFCRAAERALRTGEAPRAEPAAIAATGSSPDPVAVERARRCLGSLFVAGSHRPDRMSSALRHSGSPG